MVEGLNHINSSTPAAYGKTLVANTLNQSFVEQAVEDFTSKHWQEGTHSMGTTQDKQTKEYQISVVGTNESNAKLPDYYEFQNQKVKVIKILSGGKPQKL